MSAFFRIILNFLCFLFPTNRNKIVFIRKSYSGSNTTPIYNNMKERFPNLQIKMINAFPSEKNTTFVEKTKRMLNYLELITSKVIITTHGPICKSKSQKIFELWHAFPTKKAGLFFNDKIPKKFSKQIDYFLSYSEFSSLLFNSRYGMPIEKYVILGAPRNDYLFSPITTKWKNEYDHTIFYVPTYRNFNEKFGQTMDFGMKGFSIIDFDQFLNNINSLIIWKPHPNDELRIENLCFENELSNIKILLDKNLREEGYDFYQYLADSDLLITDYSSIYADYLLIDKPIIFVPTDLKSFNKETGLLLEPYEYWMPGPKCLNQKELQKAIYQSLFDVNYYKKERQFIKNIFHKYQDDQSTKRVIEFITKTLEF